MIILGITGPIGHGKTTLADFFAQTETNSIHLESGRIIAEAVDRLNTFYDSCKPVPHDYVSVNLWLSHLPQIIEEVTHYRMSSTPVLTASQEKANPESYTKLWDYLAACQNNPGLTQQTIDTHNKSNYRTVLQWLGAFGEQQIQSGLWYTELLRRAKQSNALLAIIGGVRFVADAHAVQEAGGIVIAIERPGYDQPDLNDPTEQERSTLPVNSTIVNNGSLDQLYATAKQIVADIRANALASQYETNKL